MRSSLLLAPVTAAILATPTKAATFGELVTWCAPAGRGSDPQLCEGYLEAGLELLASSDPMINSGTPVCVPAGEDRGRIISVMQDYARHHPEALDLSFPDGIGLALKDRFPCQGQATRPAARTFDELLTWCAPASRGDNPQLCEMYVENGLTLLASPAPMTQGGIRACVPAGEDRGRIIALMQDYARRDPSSRTLPRTDGLGLALKDHFPCR